MNTQTFAQTQNIAPITDEELMAATGGIAWGLLARGAVRAAAKAAPAAIAREGVSVGVHALSDSLHQEA